MDSAMPTPYTPEAVGAILVDGIDRILGPERPYSVVGFSFGAAIAGQVARLGGSRVAIARPRIARRPRAAARTDRGDRALAPPDGRS
jgi:pimeloyl-ACP methyl ester carboxylesterase